MENPVVSSVGNPGEGKQPGLQWDEKATQRASIGGAHNEATLDSTLLRSQNRRPSHSDGPQFEANSVTSTGKGGKVGGFAAVSSKILRQIIGLNPFKTSYFSLFRPLKGDPKMQLTMFLGIVCAIAAGIPLPIIGVIFARLIDEFPPTPDALQTRVSQLLGTACAYFAVTWVWSICWGMVGERVSRGLREALVEKVMGLDMAYYDTDAPDVSTALTGDTQIIQMGTSEKVGLFIQAISYFVAAFTVGFILNAGLTGVLFAAVIPTMIIMVVTGTTLVSKYQKKGAEITEEASSLATGAIDAVRVVQAFGAAEALLAKHSKILARASAANVRKAITGGIMLGMVFFIAFAANALAFYRGSRLVDGSAGTVYAVVFLILDASFVVGQFGPFLQTFALAASAGGKIFKILDREPSAIDVYSEEGIKSQTCFENDIKLEKVTFVYPARTTDRVLDQVNLHFKAHTHTGVVGKSGSGKSTIASLLMRFYDPSSGRVMIGENNIQDFHLATLRSQIALVDQDPTLFTGTILDNIRHGIPNADQLSDEEVRQRCAQAAVDANATFISDLAKGIHTKVSGSGGAALSGGQRQRICLARALVRRPRLLILDEPTSSLDSTSEALVLEALRKVPGTGCTVITIAHRLATIKDADNIIVMDQGTMLEQGSHQELVEKDGAYKAFVDAQQMETTTEHSEIQNYAKGKTASDEDVAALNKEEEVEEEQEKAETKKDLPISTVLRRVLTYVKPERPLVILGLCCSTVSGAIIVGEAIVFGNLITLVNGSSSATSYSQVDFYCLMFFVISLVALVTYASSSSLFGIVSEKLMLKIRSRSLSTILRQDIAWFSKPGHSSSELLSTMQMDVSNLSGLSGVLIGTIFTVVTCVTAGMILAHIIAWRIAVVILAAVPVMIFAAFIRLRVLGKFEKRHETAYNDASALATEAVRAIRVVAAFGRESDVMRRYRKAIQKPYEQAFRFSVLGNSMLAFSLAIPFFVYSLAYWWGSTNVREGRYSARDFFIVLPALLYSAQMAGQLFSLAPELTRAKSASRNVFDLHDAKPTIMKEYDPSKDETWKSEKASNASSSEKSSLARGAAVSLEKVSFSYPSRQDVSVLKDVSLSIKPGQFIGVVGRSGAGKSSLISLLERFYDPTDGGVRVDNNDIRNVPVEDHRARLALVAQDPDLFPGSITFNVGLGASPGYTVSQETIEDVCKKVGLHDFIMSLSEGYNTECGRNGSQLSGGQKQRVAIARALIRNPDVLILDEATSSLDSKSEREVQEATNAATSDRTTIVVAHRLSTVQKADRIFVFERGELVEQGTHEELVALGGIYTGMVRTQELGGAG